MWTSPTRMFQHAWKNGLRIYNKNRNSPDMEIRLSLFRRQFQDIKDINFLEGFDETHFIKYEEEFNDNLNKRYGYIGLMKLVENEQNLFNYKRFLDAVLKGNLSSITDDDICRILLRVHRNDPKVWKADIPDLHHRVNVDHYDTYSHPNYTK